MQAVETSSRAGSSAARRHASARRLEVRAELLAVLVDQRVVRAHPLAPRGSVASSIDHEQPRNLVALRGVDPRGVAA